MFVVSAQAFADQTPAQEVSARSGLPLSEIQEILAKCDSASGTTQDMYFCAWRDLVVAERDLQKIVDQSNSQRPERKTALDARIAHWKKIREVNCRKAAHRKYAGGSIEPVAVLHCQVGKTQNMAKAMRENPTAIPCKSVVDICHHDLINQ